MEKFEIILLSLLFTHWIADFVLQTDKMAKGKSKNWKDLLSHTLTYSLTMWVTVMLLTNAIIAFCFWLITFVCHTITDYFTSRLNSKLWDRGKVHNFFVSVGFDQLLHYLQLYFTIKYLLWLPILQYL